MNAWNGAWAASVTYLTTDQMDETTPKHPNGTGRTFSAGDVAVGLTYSQMLTDKFSVGGTVKYINETLADKSASGWAADVGTYYNTGWRSVRIAMLTSNFGPDMNFVDGPFPMPMNFTFGMAGYLRQQQRPPVVQRLRLRRHPRAAARASPGRTPTTTSKSTTSASSTATRTWPSSASARRSTASTAGTGRTTRREIDANRTLRTTIRIIEYPLFSETGNFFGNGATIGAGVKLPKIGLTIDYAYTGIAYLDNIHRFSLGYKFPKLIF